MAFAAALGPLISGLASIGGALVSASAMNAQANSETEIATFNANEQRKAAGLAQSRGAIESEKRDKEGQRQAAIARATMAQGGAATDTGTSLLLEQEFAAQKDYNKNIAMFNAKTEQANLLNKAAATEFEGQIRSNASRASGTAALLTGFAKSLGSIKFG